MAHVVAVARGIVFDDCIPTKIVWSKNRGGRLYKVPGTDPHRKTLESRLSFIKKHVKCLHFGKADLEKLKNTHERCYTTREISNNTLQGLLDDELYHKVDDGEIIPEPKPGCIEHPRKKSEK